MIKRFSLLIFLPVILCSQLVAQVVKTSPAFPSENEPLTIIFDASSTPLEDFNGDIYAHTGVIISEEDKNTGSWSYVVSNWGENLPELQLTPLGDDLWELEIDDIRDFYDVPTTVERIYQLAMVFRSADTSLQTTDIFIDIFRDELLVRIFSPFAVAPNPYFAELNEMLEFEIEGTSPEGTLSSMTLFDGDTEIASSSNTNRLEFDYEVTSTGRTDFLVVAEDGSGNVAEDSLYVIVNPDVVRLARPEGIEDGITYHDNGSSVTFSFYGPEKEFAYIIGDATDWEVRDEYFMYLDDTNPNSPHFWLTVENLTPGDTYLFQYLIDGGIRVADLFSEVILDPSFDRFISSSVYPDLPEYPHGLTDFAVSVVQPGRDEYVWQVPDFQRPPNEELIIYELLLRDFLEESSFEVLADTLDYLENLGINAIELMPVSEFDGNISWGYNPTFHGALDKSYGTQRSFKRFVDEAHSRGIAVILDVVYNHAHEKSPLIRTFGTTRSNSFADGNPLIGPGHAYNVFNHLDHDHEYIKYWLDRMNRHWLETYNVDGFRFDLTKGFASNVDDRSLLDGNNPERIENLKRMYDVIQEYDDSAYIILEHFAANSEESELANYGMLLWGNHNRNYSQASMGYTGNSNFQGVHYQNRNGWENPHLIGYMESHDEQWLMYRNLSFGVDDNPDHDVTELDVALNRQKLTAAFFLTVPGPKMLWQFGELGYGSGARECLKPGDGSNGECAASDPGRTDPKPIRWNYYEEENRYRLYKSWSELLRLRHTSPVFSSGATDFSSSLNGEVKWIRLEHDDMDVLIIGNFGVTFNNATGTFTSEGDWYEFVKGTTLEVGSELTVDFSLAPGELKIFTSQFVEPAEENVFFKVGESDFATLPDTFVLEPNFPNPFNPSTTLKYTVPEQASVTLEVFDVLGRKITTLVDDPSHVRGNFTVTFNAEELASGIYIARLVSGNTSVVQKMMLIK